MSESVLTEKRGWSTWLFNPFHYVAGGTALAAGLVLLLASCLIGAVSNSHFDGVLDFHTGKPMPWWFFPLEGTIDWLCLAIPLLLLGKLLSKSRVRAIDVFGTQALARGPYLLLPLFALLPVYQQVTQKLTAAPLGLNLTSQDMAVLGVTSIVVILSLVWMLTLMYRAFSVSCNIRGGKAVGAFIGAVIVGEILSKVALFALFSLVTPVMLANTPPPGSANAPIETIMADSPALTQIAQELVTALSTNNYGQASKRFTGQMQAGLPEKKLQEVWQQTLEQQGAFKQQGTPRQQSYGGFQVVFVPCSFERGNLDIQVTIDKDMKVSGLYLRSPGFHL